MGNCVSGWNEDLRRSKLIDRIIKRDKKKMSGQVKLLVVGTGESGKSTILKQMRIIQGVGFDSSERERYRVAIFNNIVDLMRLVLDAMKHFGIPLDSGKDMRHIYPFIEKPPSIQKGRPFPIEYLNLLKSLWADAGVSRCRTRGKEFALPDNMAHFYDRIERLFAADYMPDDQDILRCRLENSGITETVLHNGQLTFHISDVGGELSMRKKWMHCFEDVTAVVFVVNISEYDQCKTKDKSTNKMQEAFSLFDSICNSVWFKDVAIIILLNEVDTFVEKIKDSPLKKYFPDYRGPSDNVEESALYLKRRFMLLNRSVHHEIYAHFTNSTDTDLPKYIMSATSDFIIKQSLNRRRS